MLNKGISSRDCGSRDDGDEDGPKRGSSETLLVHIVIIIARTFSKGGHTEMLNCSQNQLNSVIINIHTRLN